MRRSRSTWPVIRLSFAAAFCLLQPAAASAMEFGQFTAELLRGDGWQIENAALQLQLDEDGLISASVTAASMQWQDLEVELKNIVIDCPRLSVSDKLVRCAQARISASGLPFDLTGAGAAFEFRPDTKSMSLRLSSLGVSGGRGSVSVTATGSAWQAQLAFKGLNLLRLRQAASPWLNLPLPDGFDGSLETRMRLQGNGATLTMANGEIRVNALSGSNASGTLASENLAAAASVDLRKAENSWRLRVKLDHTDGQVYALPVFIDFSSNALAGDFTLSIPAEGEWPLEFGLEQSGVGTASGNLTFDPERGALTQLDLVSFQGELPGVYDLYLQPFLVGTSADSLETLGSISGSARYSADTLRSLRLDLSDIYLDDRRGRYALYGVAGEIGWSGDNLLQSILHWQGGYLYKVGLGSASFPLETGQGVIALREPTSIPVLDGRIVLSRFRLSHSGTALDDLEFEAAIEAIGLRALSRSLGWPAFSGSLSGRIPRVRLADNAITVAGAMNASVFDGSITVDNLRVIEPFGVLPQVTAEVKIRSLDLAALSSTFSFGHIEGRLDGDFNQLRMLGFSPVGFDARLYTTPGDRSRHRISQQAIENISDLGGAGAAAALSRGLLKFFEDFSYAEIGWSCVLEDEVCSMSGVAPAPNNGYYIVKGKGLPRINVIGYRSRVSWPTLVARLREINTEGAVRRP